MNVARLKPEVRRSMAEGLLSCPQWRMEEGEILAFGQATHTFIGAYWRHLQAVERDSDMTAVSGLAKDAWARTPGLLQARFDEFMGLCDLFASSHLGDVGCALTVEETITWDAGDVILNCTPDRVDRVDEGDPDDDPAWLRIWDYKTEQGEMDHAFQERFYTQMAFLRWPAVEGIDFVIDPIRRPREPDVLTYERGDLDPWWETMLAGLRHRLAARDAQPVGGPGCATCALRRTCGASLAALAAIPRDDAEADTLLAEHRRLEAAAGVRWDALKAWYKDRAPRIVNGEEVGWLLTREPSFELLVGASQMRLFCALSGMDQDALLRPTSITNRGLQERLMGLGLAQFSHKPPVFKTRQAEPERKHRRREARDDSA